MTLQLDIFSLPPVVEEEPIAPKPAPVAVIEEKESPQPIAPNVAYCIWRKFDHWVYTGEQTTRPERLENLAENELALPPDECPNSAGLIGFHESRLSLFKRLHEKYSQLAQGDRIPEVYAREAERAQDSVTQIEQLLRELRGQDVSN